MCKAMIGQGIQEPHQRHDRYNSTKQINEGQRMAGLGKQYPGRQVSYAKLEDVRACVANSRQTVNVGWRVNQPETGQNDE